MIPREPIVTPRLRLEPLELRHAESVWEAQETSLSELRPWFPWALEASLANTQTFAQRSMEDWDSGQSFRFVMLDVDGPTGGIGIQLPRTEHRLGEVGYWVRSDRTGRGYATEAGRAVVDFGFGPAGLYRLELRAGVENVASQRVAENLGFHREGTLRRGCPHGTAGYDCHLYGLLATDLP